MRRCIGARPSSLATIRVLDSSAGKSAYAIYNAKSKLEINVYKEGAFKVFAHDHLIAAKEVSDRVQFDAKKIEESTVRLKAPAKYLLFQGQSPAFFALLHDLGEDADKARRECERGDE